MKKKRRKGEAPKVQCSQPAVISFLAKVNERENAGGSKGKKISFGSQLLSLQLDSLLRCECTQISGQTKYI